MGDTLEAPRRRRWWLIVFGGFLVALGVVGFIGSTARPDESYWSESYGAWGIA
jgi:hypothetical protein